MIFFMDLRAFVRNELLMTPLGHFLTVLGQVATF